MRKNLTKIPSWIQNKIAEQYTIGDFFLFPRHIIKRYKSQLEKAEINKENFLKLEIVLWRRLDDLLRDQCETERQLYGNILLKQNPLLKYNEYVYEEFHKQNPDLQFNIANILKLLEDYIKFRDEIPFNACNEMYNVANNLLKSLKNTDKLLRISLKDFLENIPKANKSYLIEFVKFHFPTYDNIVSGIDRYKEKQVWERNIKYNLSDTKDVYIKNRVPAILKGNTPKIIISVATTFTILQGSTLFNLVKDVFENNQIMLLFILISFFTFIYIIQPNKNS